MLNVKRLAIKEILISVDITKPILFPYSEKEMKELMFDMTKDNEGNIFYVFNSILWPYKNKIDYSNVNFKDVSLIKKDLSKTVGIKFNPQEIYKKSLQETTLGENVEVIGNNNVNQIDLFEGVIIENTEFNNCQNVIINPQTVAKKNFSYTKLAGVKFNGSFDGTILWHTDFRGSRNAKIDPKTIKYFDSIDSTQDIILLDLPEDRGGYGATNYYELKQKQEELTKQITELIKEQLPSPKPIEEIQPLDQPKQKRKWFVIN